MLGGVLRTLHRKTTAERNATYEANFKQRVQDYNSGIISELPIHRKRKRTNKESPTLWDTNKPGVAAELLSYWLNQRKDWRIKERWAFLVELPTNIDMLLCSSSEKFSQLGEKIKAGRAARYVGVLLNAYTR